MKKTNKKVLAALMGATMMMSLAACGGGDTTNPDASATPDSSVTENVGPQITDMQEGEVKETHKLSMVDYAEGEDILNPFYKKGTDSEGNACYILKDDKGNSMNLPLDGTVIYSMEEGESYAELVGISYKADGEPVNEDQWRIYVATAAPAGGETSEDTEAPAEPEVPVEDEKPAESEAPAED